MTHTPKNIVTKYDTLTDLVAKVKSLPNKPDSYDAGDEWYGGSWDDTYRLAEMGWSEGAAKASVMAMRIADRAIATTASALMTEVVYDVSGAAYDPGAYMSGAPECWLAFKPYESKSGIRIVVNISASQGVKAETFKRRGIAIAALAVALNAKGHPVTVDVVDAAHPGLSDIDFITTQFRVANALSGSVLDIDRLVYSLAHPTVFRRLMSAERNGFRGKTCDTKWGHGIPARSKENIPGLGDYDLFLGAGHISDVSRWSDSGEQWVLETYINQTTR